MIASSIVDVLIFGTMSTQGILMAPLPLTVVASVLGAATVFAFALDGVKTLIFKRLNMVDPA